MEYIDYSNEDLSDEVLRILSSEEREIGKRNLKELLEEIKTRVMMKDAVSV